MGTRLTKMAESASYVLNTGQAKKIMFEDSPDVIAIHCRYATTGKIDDESAHPYKVGHIIGMHNGTCENLANVKSSNGRCMTDSETLFHVLANHGLQEAVYAAVGGAFALCYLDMNKLTLNFIRNDKRPLYFMAGGGDTQYWCSEAEILNLIRARALSSTWGLPQALTPMRHAFLDLNTHNWYYENLRQTRPMSIVALKPPVTEEAPKPKPTTTTTCEGRIAGKASATSVPLIASHNGIYRYRAFRGKTMKMNKALKLLRQGCAFNKSHVCSATSEAYWFNNSSYLCAACTKDPFAREAVKAQRIYKGELIRPNGVKA